MVAELFGLLTRVKVSKRQLDLEKAATTQYLFPVVGLVVGLLASLVAFGLREVFSQELALVLGGILLVFIYFLTGIIHTEGLSDFADGVMAHGTQERKREVMKDVHSGVGGVFAVVVSILIYFSTVSFIMVDPSKELGFGFPWSILAFGFVLSEVGGKLAMNVMMFIGPSSHQGMGTAFVQRATAGKLAISVVLSIAIAFAFAGLRFPVVLLGGVAGIVMAYMARRHFGGVSGDAFGAANEVGRILTIVGWVLVA